MKLVLPEFWFDASGKIGIILKILTKSGFNYVVEFKMIHSLEKCVTLLLIRILSRINL